MKRIRLPLFGRWWDHQSKPVRIGILLATLAAAIFVPMSLPTYWQAVLFFPVGIYVLLALGLNVVVGMAGLLDLGYVAFYAIGAYTTAVLTTTFGWSTWEALPLAIAAAMLAGVLLGAPTLRLRGDYLAIVTLGFGEIVRIVALNTNSLGESRGIVGIPHPTSIGPLDFAFLPLPYYYLALTAIVLAIVMIVRLDRSRVGRGWAAIREDEDAAEAMGVPAFKMKLWAFAIGASTGGLGGWLYASKVGFVSPDNFPFFFSVIILSAVVLGGMGLIPGVIAGGFALAFLPEYLRDAAAGEAIAKGLHTVIGGPTANITEYRVLLFGVIIVVMMILRPQGLLPSRRRSAELHDASAGTHLAISNETQTSVLTDKAQASLAVDIKEETHFEFGSRPVNENSPALEVSGISVRFGGVQALNDVSLSVKSGDIVGVIGPNGAGKTTFFNSITGVIKPQKGTIAVGGEPITGKRPHAITTRGIARTFQNIRLFPDMTVLENVLVGADARHKTSVPGALFGHKRRRRETAEGLRIARALTKLVGINALANAPARSLSYGDQRRLEIARALATNPSVLLLDEPAAGMNPSEKQALALLVREIRSAGVTVVLIEHDMTFVMSLCDRISVFDFGEQIAYGTPAEVQRNAKVIEAYLGVEDAS